MANGRGDDRVGGNFGVEEVAAVGPEPIVGSLLEIGGSIRSKQQTRVEWSISHALGRIRPFQKGMKG